MSSFFTIFYKPIRKTLNSNSQSYILHINSERNNFFKYNEIKRYKEVKYEENIFYSVVSEVLEQVVL